MSMKFKLDNGEILECDEILFINLWTVNVQELRIHPIFLAKQYIKAATYALGNNLCKVRLIQYTHNNKRCEKFIATEESIRSMKVWKRLHCI